MSHPSWVCGLKHGQSVRGSAPSLVTPFVGVWIETYNHSYLSHVCLVTPFVGVWIETCDSEEERHQHQVTPFVGVWIETTWRLIMSRRKTSHTLRGCVD